MGVYIGKYWRCDLAPFVASSPGLLFLIFLARGEVWKRDVLLPDLNELKCSEQKEQMNHNLHEAL